MKLDAMTIGAVGFAAFAAWYVLKKPATSGIGVNPAITSATAQRRAVGDAIGQNTDYLYSLFDFNVTQTPVNMGSGLGLHV